MKNLIFIVIAFAMFTSCENLDWFHKKDSERKCPVINTDLVPTAVANSFITRYPGATALAWFDKDGTGFCVIFNNSNGIETKAFYEVNGNFISEEVEQDGEYNNNDDSGCDCELNDNEKD